MSSGWQLKRLKQTRCCFAVAMSMISISVNIIITTALCTANVLAFYWCLWNIPTHNYESKFAVCLKEVAAK